MPNPQTSPTHGSTDVDADTRAVLLLTAALTLARLIALFRTPLELYPSEARYWLWSQSLAFGRDLKSPLIAWAIWLSTSLGSDTEPWVRLPAVLFQGGATLLVFWIGRRLYGSRTGLASAALYALAPGILVSATVVAPGAPLLFFFGLALCAYVALQGAEGRVRLMLAAGLGAALGLAFLSKYAAVFILIGLGLHLVLSPGARRTWSPASAAAAIGVFLLVFAFGLAWSAMHGSIALHSAVLGVEGGRHSQFDPIEAGRFLANQFAVFGPIPFAVLIVGAGLMTQRRRLEAADGMLLCFCLPPIAIVTIQALLSRTNSSWSAVSELPAAILVAAWLVRWRARRLLIAALAIQAVIAAGFFALVLQPRFADSLGQPGVFKKARGWAQTADLVVRKARMEQPAGLSAIAVNNHAFFYALAYYGRDYFREPLAAPLKAWLRATAPVDQSEAVAPLTARNGARVLAVAYESRLNTEMAHDFTRVLDPEIGDVWLAPKDQRQLDLFVGEAFRPGARDPVTGLPTPEWKPGSSVSATPGLPITIVVNPPPRSTLSLRSRPMP